MNSGFFIVIRYPALFYVAGMHLKICLFCAKKLPRAAEVRLQAAQNGNTPGGNEAVKERRRMRIAKHILYYLSVPAAIVLWLGGYVLLDALIFFL